MAVLPPILMAGAPTPVHAPAAEALPPARKPHLVVQRLPLLTVPKCFAFVVSRRPVPQLLQLPLPKSCLHPHLRILRIGMHAFDVRIDSFRRENEFVFVMTCGILGKKVWYTTRR